MIDKIPMLAIGIVLLTFSTAAQIVTYSLDQIAADKNVYLSDIACVLISEKRITLTGNQKKERVIDQSAIHEIMALKNSDSAPTCFIEHSPEERDAYIDFDEKFRMRSRGLDGGLIVMEWERKTFKQNVRLTNIRRDSKIALSLFEADYSLKRMIMGKKRTRVRGVMSFAGYAQANLLNGLKGTGGTNRTRFETVFYLRPDTIVEIKRANDIKIVRVKFRLVSAADSQPGMGNSVECAWADIFSKNYEKIMGNHKELRRVESLFKLYYAIRQYHTGKETNDTITHTVTPVPESIKSIKISEIVEVPSPLINEPGRIQFAWLLLSGGITFDFHGAVIIRQDD